MTSRMSKKYFDSSAGRLRRRKPAVPAAFSRSMRSITAHVLRGSSDLFASKNLQYSARPPVVTSRFPIIIVSRVR